MPIKYAKSSKNYDRMTGKTTVVHNFMKGKSTADLIDGFNNESTKPKLRQKIRIEMDRRNKLGLSNIVFNKEENSDG
jgi:hypothetical protein